MGITPTTAVDDGWSHSGLRRSSALQQHCTASPKVPIIHKGKHGTKPVHSSSKYRLCWAIMSTENSTQRDLQVLCLSESVRYETARQSVNRSRKSSQQEKLQKGIATRTSLRTRTHGCLIYQKVHWEHSSTSWYKWIVGLENQYVFKCSLTACDWYLNWKREAKCSFREKKREEELKKVSVKRKARKCEPKWRAGDRSEHIERIKHHFLQRHQVAPADLEYFQNTIFGDLSSVAKTILKFLSK